MEGNSFLMAFLKQQAAKTVATKTPPVSSKKIATTGNLTGEHKLQNIKAFAKTKPKGKDVEDYFRRKIEMLEAEDSD
jgi:hypothetical protein